MQNEGKSYDAYLTEKTRYVDLNLTEEEKFDRMKRVIDYKANVTIAKQTNAIGSKDVIFLPDVGVDECRRFFYSDISQLLLPQSMNMTFKDMPNIYELNTKRYEVQWINYMRHELALNQYDLIIAHGTSADAMLRYVESNHVSKLLLVDGSNLYTAGERHGRAYHYELMKRNVRSFGLLSTSMSHNDDTATLAADLRIDLGLVTLYSSSGHQSLAEGGTSSRRAAEVKGNISRLAEALLNIQ